MGLEYGEQTNFVKSVVNGHGEVLAAKILVNRVTGLRWQRDAHEPGEIVTGLRHQVNVARIQRIAKNAGVVDRVLPKLASVDLVSQLIDPLSF
jgi:hypothetical protein